MNFQIMMEHLTPVWMNVRSQSAPAALVRFDPGTKECDASFLSLPPESRLVAVSDCPADDLYEVEATWPTVTFCYDKLPTT